MKTRIGFVSNSSSSSFIVCFPHKPADVVDMQRMLFGSETRYENPYQYGNEPTSWAASEVAETVFRDVVDQKPLTLSEIAAELDHHYDTNVTVDDTERPEYPDYPSELWDMDLKSRERHPAYKEYVKKEKEYQKKSRIWAEKMAASFIANARSGEFYKFSYSDNDGVFQSALEHGDLFKNLPHIRVSNH